MAEYDPDQATGLNVPNATSDAAAYPHIIELVKGLRGRIIRNFAAYQYMSDHLASMVESAREGVIATITGQGAWLRQSGKWRQFSMRGITYESDHETITTNSVGLFSIPHSLGVSACIAWADNLYAGNLGQLTNTIIKVREFKTNEVVFMAINRSDGQGKPNETMIVQYHIAKFDI